MHEVDGSIRNRFDTIAENQAKRAEVAAAIAAKPPPRIQAQAREILTDAENIREMLHRALDRQRSSVSLSGSTPVLTASHVAPDTLIDVMEALQLEQHRILALLNELEEFV